VVAQALITVTDNIESTFSPAVVNSRGLPGYSFERAARDFAEKEPRFALRAGLAALRWLSLGHGYEITARDVREAYHSTLKAAETLGTVAVTKERIQQLVGQEVVGGFVRQVLGRELGLV